MAVIVALSAALGTTACCDDCGGPGDISRDLVGLIGGDVKTVEGAPVAAANVQLLYSQGCRPELIRERQTITNGEGRYAFVPFNAFFGGPYCLAVEVTKDGRSVRSATDSVTFTRGVDVHLDIDVVL